MHIQGFRHEAPDLFAVACLVSACGQKGPLYLPDDSKDPNEQAQSSQKPSKAHKHDTY
jgi:predicted small lipoprotein YifL